ncbi:unnamed protein product [Porites evermanni]|uniref:Uncharacterized protein n=1 Tax=Porites evermanni TaxID=104178 RepID=A0ABN8M8J4_9CNID|nr:unnamed protein product [Porites evermanni]
MDEVDNTADRNLGLKKRGSFTTGDAEVGIVCVPLCDVFNLDKLLLDGLEIKIKIDLNSRVLNHTETDLFNGLIPQCIIFGMVRNDAYNGNLGRNPFNFQLFDLNAVRLTVNGEEMPYSGIGLIGCKKIDGYNTLFSDSGDMNCGHGTDIDREEWEQG